MFLQPLFLSAILASSTIFAKPVTYCKGDVCFAVSVPASTASSGSGDIYMQISGPNTMSWIGLGQGSSMKGSNIFVIYADSTGTNVTLSPRLGVGETEPEADTSAKVTLLDGSGIANGKMVANIKCAWNGGSMSLTGSSSKWIWAYKAGSALSSNSVNANIAYHDQEGVASFNLQAAAGGENVNPFVATVSTSTSSGTSSGTSNTTTTGSDSTPSQISSGSSGATTGSVSTLGQTSYGASDASTGRSHSDRVLIAHAVLASLAYVILFPSGAIAIRTFSFPNLLWLHAGWMVAAYMMVLASLGMGVWIARSYDALGTTHAIIGIMVAVCLSIQPISGLTHHILYKRQGGRNVATFPHLWLGRAAITLGIINGWLGLKLADHTTNGKIAYVVVAVFMWALWMAAIVLATVKSRKLRGMDELREPTTEAAGHKASMEGYSSHAQILQYWAFSKLRGESSRDFLTTPGSGGRRPLVTLHLYQVFLPPSKTANNFVHITSPTSLTMGMGRVLVIAGSDSSGGALVSRHPLLPHFYPATDSLTVVSGIEADQKVIAAHGCYAMTATTALTVQNTQGVEDIHYVPAEFVGKLIDVSIRDVGVDVVKTGKVSFTCICPRNGKIMDINSLETDDITKACWLRGKR
ncbi:hypothetical protein DSL72_007142 [Monilinia vaccinii-corymbosi]|uniref:Cytochrome b561 domain-containing protein n=1 Tax=Monilinia vaccinii-corymbosi TaxID=61207 RepID=A0A8A3PL09_9HELO|nr:hypothetical protein DSL72_007142 [Monilinia vaccinii-corymbosi]